MKRPLNPYLVLALAIVLPGGGHVAVGQAQRGLVFAFFTLLFMVLSYLTTTPEHSFLGRLGGGLFVWALSLTVGYRRARTDWVTAQSPSR